jgi:predicted AAA+ superfamily ATPase
LRVDISDDLNDDFLILDHEKFKLYLNDVGLLAASYDESYKFQSIEDFKNKKLKSLYQNFVCQEVTYAGEYIRCFNSKKNGEIEFILTIKSTGTPIPIVIKSGTYYKTHKSLNYAIKSNRSIKRAFVLCNSNIQGKGKIEYLPVWCMGLFPRENPKHIPLLRIPKLVV